MFPPSAINIFMSFLSRKKTTIKHDFHSVLPTLKCLSSSIQTLETWCSPTMTRSTVKSTNPMITSQPSSPLTSSQWPTVFLSLDHESPLYCHSYLASGSLQTLVLSCKPLLSPSASRWNSSWKVTTHHLCRLPHPSSQRAPFTATLASSPGILHFPRLLDSFTQTPSWPSKISSYTHSLFLSLI